MWAHIVDSEILSVFQDLPDFAKRSDTGEWVLNPTASDPITLAACGISEVEESPRPADTPTEKYVASVEAQMVDPQDPSMGVKAVKVWTPLAKTQEEIDRDTMRSDKEAIRSGAQAAFQTTKDYLALADPSSTEVKAQVEHLSRVQNKLLKYVLAPSLQE